jgi:hypothetical protein
MTVTCKRRREGGGVKRQKVRMGVKAARHPQPALLLLLLMFL